jgi:transglutaminase-like putative cysteine protease
MSSYAHTVMKILDVASLERGQNLSIEFDPAYQRLEVHYVMLRRKGVTIDLLGRRGFKVIQREENLESDLYDARLTALLLMEGLENGDTLEYAYTRRGQNPIFGGRFMSAVAMQYDVPVRKRYTSLRVPRGRQVDIRYEVETRVPEIVTLDGFVEYRWEDLDLPALEVESSLPSWFDPYPGINFSEFRSWKEVVDWAAGVYAAAGAGNDGVAPVVERLRRKAPDPEGYARGALEFVQDEIRYFGMEVGENSHRPTSPARVLTQRFGDCKDKALLLCALLEGGGIRANPVLVNTYKRDRIDPALSWPLAFNHVVVRVLLGTRAYYVDPTAGFQRGGIQERCISTAHKGLIVGGGIDTLVDIPAGCGGASFVRYEEIFSFNGFDSSAVVEATTMYQGSEADEMREYCRRQTASELEQTGRRYYAGEYRGVRTLEPLRVGTDDTVANTLILLERYAIDSFWIPATDINRREAAVYASALKEYIDLAPGTDRKMPLGIPHPVSASHHITVAFPEPWDVEDDTYFVEDSAFRFKGWVKKTGNRVEIEYEYNSLRDWVAPDELGSYSTNVTLARENIGMVFYKYPDGAWSFTWVFYAVAAVTLLVGGLAARNVLRKRPASNTGFNAAADPVANLHPQDEAKHATNGSPGQESMEIREPRGIAGWLVVPAIGLILSPVRILVELGDSISVFNTGRWDALTTAGQSGYHPAWGAVLAFLLALNIVYVMFYITAAISFFRKLRKTRVLMVSLYIFGVVVAIADAVITDFMSSEITLTEDTSTDIARVVIGTAIWIPYFLRSRRVKNTFVE